MKSIIFTILTLLFISCPNKNNINYSRVTAISFECNLIEDDNGGKILEPYEIYFDVLINNTSTDTLYFGSSNELNFPLKKYGYFILISPFDTIELNTSFNNLYAIPPEMSFYVFAMSYEFQKLKEFSISTNLNSEKIYDKLSKYRLEFIPNLEDFTSYEINNLAFPTKQSLGLDSISISYLSGGKSYLELNY